MFVPESVRSWIDELRPRVDLSAGNGINRRMEE